MAAFDDDDRPKKKIAHEIGQDLALMSVAELNERIALLQEEIARLEADIAKKQASRSAAPTSSSKSDRMRKIDATGFTDYCAFNSKLSFPGITRRRPSSGH